MTRRILRRQLRLRPEKSINELLLYMLVVAAARYEIKIHCFQFLSNHFHIILSYSQKRLPKFMQFFDSQVGRALNCYQGMWETVWAPGSYNKIDLLNDDKTKFKYLLYVLNNVVEAGLVKSAKEWPGVRILPHEIGTRRILVRRPEFFCDADGDIPEVAVLTTSMPPLFGMSEQEARVKLSRDWKRRERAIQLARRIEGKSFLGPKKILAQSPLAYPKGHEPRRAMNPRVASVCKWARIERLQQLVEFINEYYAALERFCGGERTAIFPSGTYEMQFIFGAPCRDPVPI